MIRPVELSDAAAIADIYNYYIDETIITFECDCIDSNEIASRIAAVSDEGFPWIVYVDDESAELLGYAYAGKWRKRIAYRFVVESAIYLRKDCTGKGIGRKLYDELFRKLREKEIRSVIAGISLPNGASVAAHRAMGFRNVGVFEKVGFKFDRWIDVEFWQLDL
jgi:phosphinothricin acetyltransferase